MRERLVKTRPIVFCCLLFTAVVLGGAHSRATGGSAAPRFETRCGWLSNPTPANLWLYDREGQWIIGAQGGYQIEGEWDRPRFAPGQWVETNGHYGYGCACLRLRVNRKTGRVLEVSRGRARPLAVCRRDRSLKKWKRLLD